MMPFHPQPRAKAEVVTTGFEEAMHEGVSLYIPGALPGERVAVRLVERQGKRWLCRLEQILQPRDRQQPVCPIWRADCACPLMIATHANDLKRRLVEDALGVPVQFVPAQQTLHYRSKVVLVGQQGKLGAYRRGSHDFNDLDGCVIEEPAIADVAKKLRRLQVQTRYVVMRATSSGEVLLTFIGEAPPPDMRIMQLAPQVKGVYFAKNTKPGNAIWDEPPVLLAGVPHIVEHIEDLDFQVSPQSFFQVHRAQAALLRKHLRLQGHVWDLYCGVGVNALALAKSGCTVHGMESVAAAVDDARANALRNGLKATFSVVDLDKAQLPDQRPDAVVLNPPRKGAPLHLVEAISAKRPKTIVYIACAPKPVAAAKRVLAGYTLERVLAFDLFPHTEHVETLAFFTAV